ncbi:alpha-glucuronidase [Pantoea deleyi]|uniref:Alpha-glucuronidase n=1 Tax=Pantoea deleyi TaxID=470932 RepID=A0A506Q203_9GAMM|nr:alpha-glucuronidase [Pantoea deleyi]ORM82061.1 alpha-glucuronidase [Pantoea deleyi]TPV39769.1 alpha-glucuronidase [Pantoea deleyi]
MEQVKEKASSCWLVDRNNISALFSDNALHINAILFPETASPVLDNLKKEFSAFSPTTAEKGKSLLFSLDSDGRRAGSFTLRHDEDVIEVSASEMTGLLYGWFELMKRLQLKDFSCGTYLSDSPAITIRMLNHWDNMDGTIERGYAGRSLFFTENRFIGDHEKTGRYARLLASAGINALTINNVNVHQVETRLITQEYRQALIELCDLFRGWGIQLFLSVNYASPIELGDLTTADPLDAQVKAWWRHCFDALYRDIPDFGGVVVKADSEHRPGPFTYHRTHADGANMLGEALAPHGGLVFWRCFVYNCQQDWRDRQTDRARAAYEHFAPLDGQFRENVILQIKNGPMDFQVREPVSPLLGAMPATNQVLELQITQEYTGQQIDLFWLVPQWKTILAFDTRLSSGPSTIEDLVCGRANAMPHAGVTAVVNTGDDRFWTGHVLAQANLYGYGRLLWNPAIEAGVLAREWSQLTFGTDAEVTRTVSEMLLSSGQVYEDYTAPLGVGWMVNPHHHYGPNIDGYEYDVWGTYHYADRNGLGVDRTLESGTGYVALYAPENCQLYNDLQRCPDELLLFFHFLRYDHRLKNGKSVIQHIYDTHFSGVEAVEGFIQRWQKLATLIPSDIHRNVAERLEKQKKNASEWRDRINTYFYRKSGIDDNKGRKIYK